MIDVLVVDDHEVVRHGLKRIIDAATGCHVAAEAATAAEARETFRNGRFDVVLLDLSLPDGNGMELLAEFKRERPEQQILILTMHPERQYAIRALRQGAAGYLTKDAGAAELLRAIRTLATGKRFITPTVAEHLTQALLDESAGPLHDRLSEREHRVLSGIVKGQSLKEIAAELGVSEKTISTYRTRMLHKMGMGSNAEVIRYAVEHELISGPWRA